MEEEIKTQRRIFWKRKLKPREELFGRGKNKKICSPPPPLLERRRWISMNERNTHLIKKPFTHSTYLSDTFLFIISFIGWCLRPALGLPSSFFLKAIFTIRVNHVSKVSIGSSVIPTTNIEKYEFYPS